MTGYIYGLYKNNDENDIFYIGATINPSARIIAHRCTFPFYIFNSRIELVIIEEFEFENKKDLNLLEAYWIQQFVAWGFSLKNYNLHYGKDVRLIKKYIEIENGNYK